jgi:hypothetical protein
MACGLAGHGEWLAILISSGVTISSAANGDAGATLARCGDGAASAGTSPPEDPASRRHDGVVAASATALVVWAEERFVKRLSRPTRPRIATSATAANSARRMPTRWRTLLRIGGSTCL